MIEKKINIIDYFKLKNSFGKAYIDYMKTIFNFSFLQE